jgi:hypothetical protein
VIVSDLCRAGLLACWTRGDVRFKKICSAENSHGTLFTERTGIRFCDQNRIAIDPDWFLIAIMIAIAFSKSGSDCQKVLF